MIYNLLEGVYLVEGQKNSAIYDTRVGNVYSLNFVAKEQILNLEIDEEFAKALTDFDLANYTPTSFSKEGVSEFTLPTPNFAWFEVATTSCNLSCRHCYIGNSLQKDLRSKMAYEDWQNVIEEALEYGIDKCQFIGGEPFLFGYPGKDLLNLCEFATEKGFNTVEIFTNLQLVDEKAISRMKDLEVKVATSLYSVSPEVHDSITRQKGSYEKTLNAIKALRQLDLEVRVELVLMSLNQGTLNETLEFLDSLGVRYRNPDPVRPTGFGGDATLIPDFDYLYKYGYQSKPNFATSEKKFFSNLRCNPCLSNKIVVTEHGDVLPCVFSRKTILGNIVESNLEDILSSDEAVKVRLMNKDEILICKDCEYRYACSDCRPLAEDTFQAEKSDELYPDPRCTYNPYTGEWGHGRWVLRDSKLHYENFLFS